jgi:hypothetical protein
MSRRLGTKAKEALFRFMLPNRIHQFAIQAKLDMYLGAPAFDRTFIGAEFTEAKNGILYIRVRSEYQASQLTRAHVTILAAVAEDILGEPVAFVAFCLAGPSDPAFRFPFFG